VQIGGPEWESFKAWCVRRRFGLVIFDTQARSTVSVDENDSTEMGEIIASLDEIKVATGACGMLVHHRGLKGDHGRGTTAVRGALDIELDVSRQGTTITLKSTKQKDRADPDPLRSGGSSGEGGPTWSAWDGSRRPPGARRTSSSSSTGRPSCGQTRTRPSRVGQRCIYHDGLPGQLTRTRSSDSPQDPSVRALSGFSQNRRSEAGQ
jgi:hypothetical protein